MLTIREKQALGAVILKKYCLIKSFNDYHVNELINHLHSILIDNLLEWENKGRELQILGRGDAIPEEIISKIPKIYHGELNELVEYVIEIGIVDMFGANTMYPEYFLQKSLGILKKLGSEINQDFFFLIKNKNTEESWGRCYSILEYQKFRTFYDLNG